MALPIHTVISWTQRVSEEIKVSSLADRAFLTKVSELVYELNTEEERKLKTLSFSLSVRTFIVTDFFFLWVS